MKKVFILLSFLIILSCNDKPQFDHYSFKDYAGNKTMEYWIRDNMEFKAIYDADNKITNLLIDDKNLVITVNVTDGKIQSYSIEDIVYKRVTNIDNEGNIENAKESMPQGFYEYININNEILVNHENIE